jgi:hypothetical protein
MSKLTVEHRALVAKWSVTGLLRTVADENIVEVVTRLERAAKKAFKTTDGKPLEEEILRMRGEGLFKK